eukprot:UN03271
MNKCLDIVDKLGANFTSQSAPMDDTDNLITIDPSVKNSGNKQRLDMYSCNKRSIIVKTPQRKDTNDFKDEKSNDSKDEKSNGDDDYEMVNNNYNQKVYFEPQEWEMCLLHSLNALYQEKKFSEGDMDKICKRLAPNSIINPHKSIFKTGNYDANVLMMALENNGVDVQWFDSRKASKELRLNDTFLCPQDKYTEFKGFILNNPHKRMIVFNRRHWLTIKRINNVWYDFRFRNKDPQS